MTVHVEIMPKEGILDPQGKTVMQALHQLGYDAVQSVRVGKRIELQIDTSDPEDARRQAAEMADKLLANENVESYVVHLPGEEGA